MKFEETDIVELKESLNDTLEKEIVAFLNTNGGTIYIGVKDNGEVIGVINVDELMKKISESITERILPNPQELVDVSAKYINGKMIIEISVKKGNSLYYIKKYGRSATGCYVRVGSTCRSMTEEQIENNFINTLDIPPLTMFSMLSPRKDLTFNEFKSMLLLKGVHISEYSIDENFYLKNNDGNYNYIAFLLSDQNNTSIKVCKFKGLDKSKFISRKEFDDGCILRKMEQALEYVENVINLIQTEIKDGKNRTDTPLFDMESFKEAWYNAVCHNLWIEKIPPAIYSFDDRIEIISQGLLRKDLSKEEFYRGVSKPVNEEFAYIFLKMHYIEQSGKGISTIVGKYGKDVFKFGTSFIECVLPYNIVNRENYYSLIGNDLDEIENKQINGNVNGSVNGNVKLNDIQIDIIKTIKINKKITMKELAITLAKGTTTISRNVKFLKDNGILLRIGSDKTGYWEIIDKK